MKKIILFLTAITFLVSTFAATGFSNYSKNANNIFLPIGNDAQISLADLSKIKVKDYETISGQHLNFFQRITFKAAQKQLRKSIAADGTINSKKLMKALSNDGITSGFNIGWFALGFFLGLIGVLLSYIINGDQDVKKNRQKWAWIGLAAWIVIFILLIL